MQEKRLVDRLSKYWDRLRKDNPFPQFERLSPDAIDDVWPRCIVLGVEKQATKMKLYTYQHMGRDIVDAYGDDLTGNYVNMNMHNFPGWQVLKSVDDIFAEPQIMTSMGNFINEKDEVVKYRACIMPFGKNEEITHVLVGLSWKIFS